MRHTDSLAGASWADGEAVIKRFEEAWHGHPRPDLADFLPAEADGHTRLLVELVHVDLEFRLRAGEAVRVEHYLARFPALGSEREAFLELVAAEYDLRRRADP